MILLKPPDSLFVGLYIILILGIFTGLVLFASNDFREYGILLIFGIIVIFYTMYSELSGEIKITKESVTFSKKRKVDRFLYDDLDNISLHYTEEGGKPYKIIFFLKIQNGSFRKYSYQELVFQNRDMKVTFLLNLLSQFWGKPKVEGGHVFWTLTGID